MPLIVEDGTGTTSPGANAYISIADAAEYHVDHNNTAWAALTTAQKTAAILYATDYIDNSRTWRGTIVEEDQALGLPTEGGYDDQGREITGLPIRVANATAELALIHATTTPLNVTLGPRVVEQEVTGAVRVVYSDRIGNDIVKYPTVERMLKGLFVGGGVQFLESMGS